MITAVVITLLTQLHSTHPFWAWVCGVVYGSGVVALNFVVIKKIIVVLFGYIKKHI